MSTSLADLGERSYELIRSLTIALEQEIRKLSSKGNLSKQDRDELARLKDEVSYINKAKSDCKSQLSTPEEREKANPIFHRRLDVESHPEHRKYVFPERAADQSEGQASDEPAGLYDKNGRLKHPERSIYFDPVFNPFGAPPPGMPYREKRESIIRLDTLSMTTDELYKRCSGIHDATVRNSDS